MEVSGRHRSSIATSSGAMSRAPPLTRKFRSKPNSRLNDVVPSLTKGGTIPAKGRWRRLRSRRCTRGTSRRLNGKAGEWRSNLSTPPLVSRCNGHAWLRNEP